MAKIRLANNLDEIDQYYSIVVDQYFTRFGVGYNHRDLIEDYYAHVNSRKIYVIDDSGVIGGFELCSANEVPGSRIPCEKHIPDISRYLPKSLNTSKNYIELSKLVITKVNNRKSLSLETVSVTGDICFGSQYDGLVILAPTAQTHLYRRVLKGKSYGASLHYEFAKETFNIDDYPKDFYLTIILRKNMHVKKGGKGLNCDQQNIRLTSHSQGHFNPACHATT